MRNINRVIAKLSVELDTFRLPEQGFEATHVADQIDVLKKAKVILKHHDTFRQTLD